MVRIPVYDPCSSHTFHHFVTLDTCIIQANMAQKEHEVNLWNGTIAMLWEST